VLSVIITDSPHTPGEIDCLAQSESEATREASISSS